jgi:hypothetical protein
MYSEHIQLWSLLWSWFLSPLGCPSLVGQLAQFVVAPSLIVVLLPSWRNNLAIRWIGERPKEKKSVFKQLIHPHPSLLDCDQTLQ